MFKEKKKFSWKKLGNKRGISSPYLLFPPYLVLSRSKEVSMSIKAHKLIIIYIAALLALSGNGIAGEKDQAAEKFELTVDNIMEGSALTGTPPSGIMWSQDGKQLYFIWKKPEAEKA